MNIGAKKRALKCLIATFALTFIIGCSPENSQILVPPTPPDSTSQKPPSDLNPPASSPQVNDTSKELLINMKQFAAQGKVINCDFPVKTVVIEDIITQWGKPDKTDWVPAAKGNYATYSKYSIVFGFNKGSQIFEVRSYDKQLQSVSFNQLIEVYGAPAYDVKVNGEEIIGYLAGPEFKLEFVFSQPTGSNPNPKLDHYLVLYPRGTVNSMADDPGRQW